MRIEVLYVPGCPNYQPTVDLVRKLLASESVTEILREVPVNTDAEAQSLAFPGSPTVRVNGNDIEPNRTVALGLACRLYENGTGVPSEQIVRAAISEAKAKE